MEYSMIMGQVEEDLHFNLNLNQQPKEKVKNYVLNEDMLDDIKRKGRKLIRTTKRTKHWTEYTFIKWYEECINKLYGIPVFFNNGHSEFVYLFSGMWTMLLESEKNVKRRCKERKWDYKTYKHGI